VVVRFEVFMAGTIKNAELEDVMPCGSWFLERATRRYIPENGILPKNLVFKYKTGTLIMSRIVTVTLL
jgi:hypothetical protein